MANMQGSYQVVVKDLSVIEKIATAYETINAKPLQDGTLYLLSLKECYDFDLKCDEEKQIEITRIFWNLLSIYPKRQMNRAIGWEIRWQIIMRTVKRTVKEISLRSTADCFSSECFSERYSCSVLC